MEKWKGGRVSSVNDFKHGNEPIKVGIGDYNTGRVIIFGANMVMARSLPFIIDGLKPVARRALCSIYRAAKNKATTLPNAIAETMKIHPHGDSSIYECIIGMAQPWKKMLPLIDSMEENYGSAAGDMAADARYLKTKLSKYSLDCFFEEYDENVIEMKPNYDENMTEPLYLPSKYPNAFINGGDGMAWGYSTNIPTYNITDILEFTIELIRDPNCEFRLLIPDSPTGCDIINSPDTFYKLQYIGFPDESDRSYTFTYQSVIDINESDNTLVIKSLPPGRTTEPFFKGIEKMKKGGELDGCTKVKNESQDDRIKIILCFKNGVNLEEMRNKLISVSLGTKLVFSAQTTMVDNKNSFDLSVTRYSVKDCLLHWIDYRRDFKRRFYHRKIVETKARIHILEEMIRVFSGDNYKRTTKIIHEANSKEELVVNLIREYGIDSLQANAIANMRQYETTKGIKKKLKAEEDKLIDSAYEWVEIIKDTKKIDDIIVKELRDGISKYGSIRKSNVI